MKMQQGDDQSLRDKIINSPRAYRRAVVGAVILSLILSALIFRLSKLQFDDPHQYTRLATLYRPSPEHRIKRGAIYDREGRFLATSIPRWSVFADPPEVQSPLETARILSRILDVDINHTSRKLLQTNRRFSWIKRQVSDSRAEWVRALELKGIHLRREYKRFHPFGSLLSHVVGFTDIDGRGLEGVEARFNEILSGERQIRTDSPLQNQREKGYDIYLTIDAYIQSITRNALVRQVERHEPEAAWALVMDVRNGEVLSMVNWPDFDPGAPASSPYSSRRNRILADTYEYGSVLKPITAAIALEENVVEPDTEFDCHQGEWRYGRRRISDVRGHGELTVSEIITYSSNIGVSQIGLKTGTERFWWGLRRFGFGELTGIELGGESVGIMRPISQWNDHSLISIAFGQELSVNALALACSYAALANDGMLVQPTLIGKIYDPVTEGKIFENETKEIRRAVSENTAKKVLAMMERVVKEGTGTRADVKEYRVGGKTGTGTLMSKEGGGYSRDRYISTFVGVAPVDDPKIVVLVSLKVPTKGGYYGGTVAGPAFKEIVRDTLAYLNVPPNISRDFMAKGKENVN